MPRSHAADELLTVADLKRRLKLSGDAIADLIESGDLLAFDVGTGKKKRNFRVTPEDYADFIERRRVKPQPKSTRVIRRKFRRKPYEFVK